MKRHFIMNSTDIQLPDMNIPCNLEYYRQIVLFENDLARKETPIDNIDPVRKEIAFDNLDRSQQRAVQSIAHSRNLEYEYQLGCAKVFQSVAVDSTARAFLKDFPQTMSNNLPHGTATSQNENSFAMPSEIKSWDSTRIGGQLLGPFSGATIGETGPLLDQNFSSFWSAPDLNSYSPQFDSLWAEPLGWEGALTSATSDEPLFTNRSSPDLPTQHAFGVNSRPNSLMSSTPISPIVSPSMIPADGYEIGYDTNSISSSINSVQSERGRTMISKRKQVGSSWSMNSTKRSKRASSGGSGRSGPLDYLARLGMKAVKAVGGACWRCKILGKKCTEENPCETCPKRNNPGKATWSLIGCKRGALGDEMQPVTLCPFYIKRPLRAGNDKMITERIVRRCPCKYYWCEDRSGGRCPKCSDCQVEIIGPLAQVDRGSCLEATRERREKDIESASESSTGKGDRTVLDRSLLQLRKNPLLENLGLTSHRSTTPPSPAPLTPLDQCLLAIVWELTDNPSHLPLLPLFGLGTNVSDEDSLESLIVLLRSAALYQASLENDPHQLIAQSLICLRDVLETKRAVSFGAFQELLHWDCYPSSPLCYDRNIKDLTLSLTRYTDQLSLVFFKKENLRGKSWWLSVFYSLVIQSAIRTVLLTIMNDASLSISPSINQYLHLALRLFIATSGEFDPLTNASRSRSEMLENESYEKAKSSVRQEKWASVGLMSSGEYLCQLFEDHGLPIVPQAAAKLADHSLSTIPASGLLERNEKSHRVEGVDLSHTKSPSVTDRNMRNVESSAQFHQKKIEDWDNTASARQNPLYINVVLSPDGLYHCPWEGKPSCYHRPEKLKCNYDKFVDAHLKPYRCKIPACEGVGFSSTACLLRHEREAHAMHGHGNKPYLCTYEGCERAAENNGFNVTGAFAII